MSAEGVLEDLAELFRVAISDSAASVSLGSVTRIAAPVLAAEAKDCVLTYAGERGEFADTNKPADVPEEARGLVRVTLLSGPEPPAGAWQQRAAGWQRPAWRPVRETWWYLQKASWI